MSLKKKLLERKEKEFKTVLYELRHLMSYINENNILITQEISDYVRKYFAKYISEDFESLMLRSGQDAGKVFRRRFKMQLKTIFRYKFREPKVLEKFAEKLMEMVKIDEDHYNLEKMIEILSSFRTFFEVFDEIKHTALDLEFIISYLFNNMVYTHETPEIFFDNIKNIHRTTQQQIFKDIDQFIKIFAEKTHFFIKDNRFDIRNKDSVLWANAISKLINPETKKPYNFDSEFRKTK